MIATHLGFFNAATSRTHVRFQFSTHAAAGGNVAPSSAFENADLRIYRATDGAGFTDTQRSSANGITMTSPFDSLIGFHSVTIDLTDNSDAGFYAAGSLYAVVLAPDETVDSATLTGVVLAYFEIGPQPVNVTHFGGSAGTFASGRPDVNASHHGGTSQTGRDIGASVLLSPGTGTGQLDITSGVVKSNFVQILGSAITGTAAQLAAAVTKFFNVASPTGTVNSLPDAVPGAAGGVFIAGTNAPVVITGSGNALTLTSTGSNGHGLAASGNGTGSGILADSGAGASGDGIVGRALSTNGQGIRGSGSGSGIGILGAGGATAHGIAGVGGSTSGSGLYVVGQGNGHGISAAGGASAGNNGMTLLAGTSGSPLGFSGPQIGSSGNDTTHVHLSTLTFGDDEINDYLLVIEDNSESELHLRWIEDWVASTKLATVAALPFTPAGASDRAALVPLTRRDVTIGSIGAAAVRSAVGLAAANVDTQLSNIHTKTTNLPASPAAVGSAMTLTSGERTSIAEALLKLDWTTVTGEAQRSALNALRFLRNKWTISGGVLSVKKENDSTEAWNAAVTTTAGNPVSEVDPT